MEPNDRRPPPRLYAAVLRLLCCTGALFCFPGAGSALNMAYPVVDGQGRAALKLRMSCSEAAKELSAIRQWKLNLGEVPGPMPELTEEGDGRCGFLLQESMPAAARFLFEKNPAYNGINCWNTVLTLNRMSVRPRFSSKQEMSFWMKSPYCRELPDGESPVPGDVIALRSFGEREEAEEVHGMLYISPRLVFQKGANSTQDPASFAEAQDAFNRYRMYDPDCWKIRGVRPSACGRWANVYHCEDPSAARRRAYADRPWLGELAAKFDIIEKGLSAYALAREGGGFSDGGAALRNELVLLAAEIEKRPAAGFFGDALKLAVLSAQKQVDFIVRQDLRRGAGFKDER